MTKRVPPYSPEVRARAVWLVLEQQGERGSQWTAIHLIAAKIGCSGDPRLGIGAHTKFDALRAGQWRTSTPSLFAWTGENILSNPPRGG